MTNDDGCKPEGAPQRSPKAGAGAPSGVDRNGPRRFSVQRKMAIVARLLRGEPLELVARETNVSIRSPVACASMASFLQPRTKGFTPFSGGRPGTVPLINAY
jgi:hypothetical protein